MGHIRRPSTRAASLAWRFANVCNSSNM
jgi:hypothetical protein